NVCMTSPHHASGTDRIAEVAAMRGWGEDVLVVNVQGDEPLIEPGLIGAVAQHLHEHPLAAISTACHRIYEHAEMLNPNVVKVVLDRESHALYFSRAPIPYARDAFAAGEFPMELPVFRHIGIYASAPDFLKSTAALRQQQLNSLRRWNNCAPCGTATGSALH
ncbi:MAG: hypothetical protein Q7U24_02685, partial [Sulfurimicrobium sp.]|nr:hypothetical protein [Sulfurimicrobium sp.]